jgi:cytochrome c oxidase subunit I+III
MGDVPLTNTGGASIPHVTMLYPMWDQPGAMRDAVEGRHLLARPTTRARETLRVSAVTARPEQVIQVPGPGWVQLVAALATAVMFGAGTFHLWGVGAAAGVVTLAVLGVWAWGSDRYPSPQWVDIGMDIAVPTYGADTGSHAWWAGVVSVVFDATAFLALLSAYVFLWLVNPVWPPPPYQGRLDAGVVAAGAALLVASSLLAHGGAALHRQGRGWGLPVGLGAAVVVGVTAGYGIFATLGQAGLPPTHHAFPAMVWMMALYTQVHLAAAAMLAAFVLARQAAGLVTPHRRMTVMLTLLAWDFAVFTGVASMAVLALWPPAGGGGGVCSW